MWICLGRPDGSTSRPVAKRCQPERTGSWYQCEHRSATCSGLNSRSSRRRCRPRPSWAAPVSSAGALGMLAPTWSTPAGDIVRETASLTRPRPGQQLTPPKQHQYEIRCYIRDPDGYLIEVGQTTDPVGDWSPVGPKGPSIGHRPSSTGDRVPSRRSAAPRRRHQWICAVTKTLKNPAAAVEDPFG